MIDTVSSEDFWNADTDINVTRLFPAAGMKAEDATSVAAVNSYGFYFSSSEYEYGGVSSTGDRAAYMNFGDDSTGSDGA